MSAGEKRKREELEHGQARDDKFRHLLSRVTHITCRSLQRHAALLQGNGLGLGESNRELPFSVRIWCTILIQQTGY